MDSSGRGAGGLAAAAASLRAAPASWRKLSSPSPGPLVFPPLSAAVALGTVSFGLPRIGTQDSFMGMQWWGWSKGVLEGLLIHLPHLTAPQGLHLGW